MFYQVNQIQFLKIRGNQNEQAQYHYLFRVILHQLCCRYDLIFFENKKKLLAFIKKIG